MIETKKAHPVPSEYFHHLAGTDMTLSQRVILATVDARLVDG